MLLKYYCDLDVESYSSRKRQAFSDLSQTTVVTVASLKAFNKGLSIT